MFSNCPWNLNSSILVNSAAERQAQKRKIRNGQLPMPKLIKTSGSIDECISIESSASACPSISDSLLPDTVRLSEDIVGGENALELSNGFSCGTLCLPEISRSLSSDNYICSAVISTPKLKNNSPAVSESSKYSPFDVTSSGDKLSDHDVHQVCFKASTVITDVLQKGYIDLNHSSLLRKVCLEAGDGSVLKLGCSENKHRIITVVQENKITFWESQSLISVHQFSWSIKASIPVSINNRDSQSCVNDCSANELLLELGLRSSRWTSVVLIVDSNASKSSVYSCDTLGATKIMENLPWPHSVFKNYKKLNSCLLDTSSLIIWCYDNGKGTILKKFVLNDELDELSVENELIGTKSHIKSLHSLNETKSVIVGINEEYQLIFWNHTSGNVIKSIGLFPSEISSCIGVIEDKGFLFLVANGKPGSVHLFAINVSTKNWMLLKTFTSDVKECISEYMIDGGLLLAAYQDSIKIWDLEAAIELSCLSPQKKCVPYVFSRDTVFVTDDHLLYILDNSLICLTTKGVINSQRNSSNS